MSAQSTPAGKTPQETFREELDSFADFDYAAAKDEVRSYADALMAVLDGAPKQVGASALVLAQTSFIMGVSSTTSTAERLAQVQGKMLQENIQAVLENIPGYTPPTVGKEESLIDTTTKIILN